MSYRPRGGDASLRVVAFGLVVTLLGGALLAVTYVAPLPGYAVLAGLILFVAGMVSAGVAAALDSRRDGGGFLVTVARGFRTALAWGRHFFP
jgi:hypothetical protein